ncbi:MAG: carboxypeptidase regulatory-like domain-containing protein, partial [Acidobacteriota bacterium]
TGHITRPGGGFGAGDRVYAYTRGGEYAPVGATTDASGNFSISDDDLVPGYQGQIVTFGTTANPFWTALGNTYRSFPATAGDWKIATPGANTGLDIAALAPASVSGQVLEQGNNNPISGVLVRTTDPLPTYRLGASYFQSAPSDGSGNFTISGIQPQRRYGLSAQPAQTPTNYFLSGTLDFFDVAPGATTGKVVHLEKGGKVGGTITKQSDGTPVASAIVYFYFDNCQLSSLAITSGTGMFLSPPLKVGDYKELVVPGTTSGLAQKWFGGADTCAAGTLIHVTAGANATADVALPAATATGHTVSGKVTESGSGNPIPLAFVQLFNDFNFYFAAADACGEYSATGVEDGTYDAVVSGSGHKAETFPSAVTVAGANVSKNFSLMAISGGITGHVTSGGKPVQGAQVCTTDGSCDRTDSSGFYRIFPLDAGTYKLICYVTDNLEPLFFNNKNSKATADNVVVANGAIVTGKDFVLTAVASDPGEPDGTGTPGVLSRPERENGPMLLRPGAPQTRSFADTEDTDWFRFTATSGKIYRLTITGGGFTQYGVYLGVFDGVTHAKDATASIAILVAPGWPAITSGERWIGISSAFSGSYTITLTESNPGPPPPTVTSINPTSGPAGGGTSITITGTNFVAGSTVKIGGVSATNVVFVGATTITCKSPALPAGILNDVVVTNPGPVTGTLTKGWFADFSDVPQAFLYHTAIEKIVRAGITTGCGGGKYCPSDPITRDAMAVFILKGEHGGTYNPPAATGTVFSDVSTGTFLAKWIEQFGHEGISTGCGGGSPPPYCPTASVTRDGMAVFLERGKNGSSFNPPAATGTVFCDVLTTTFLSKWMEQLKADNITQGCGSGPCARLGGGVTPNYCPGGTVTRGEMAPFIVRTFGL